MELMLIDRNSTRMFSIVEGRHEIELKGSVSSEHDKTKKPTPKTIKGFPSSSDGKESACNAGDPGSIPGSGRAPGEGNGYPLQYSCLENPMDRGAWWLQSMGSQSVRHD